MPGTLPNSNFTVIEDSVAFFDMRFTFFGQRINAQQIFARVKMVFLSTSKIVKKMENPNAKVVIPSVILVRDIILFLKLSFAR